MAESFFATLECELLDRRTFKTQAEARIAVFEFIEGFYNPRRRHSSLGYLSPIATSAATTRERLIPAHTIVPPCSGRSRCGLEMAEDVSTPTQRPTLTAPARTGVRDARAGTEKRTPQGPNRKTAVNRRTRCRHSRYPEPKPSPPRNRGKSLGHLEDEVPGMRDDLGTDLDELSRRLVSDGVRQGLLRHSAAVKRIAKG